MRDEGWVLRKHSRLGEARIMHANSEKSVQSNPRGLVAENIAQAMSLKLNYTCHGLGLGDQRRLLGGRREGGQIIRVTYILLDELSVSYAGSGDQLVGIEVNEVVAGLCRKKVGGSRSTWAQAATRCFTGMRPLLTAVTWGHPISSQLAWHSA